MTDEARAARDARRARSAGRLASLGLMAALGGLFAAQLAAVWRHRLDYPIDDDWRYYLEPGAMPAGLSLAWLFAPAEDTLHATGKLLDWLFLVVGVHDYHWLATLSFLLAVGGWLACALRLCWLACGERVGVRLAALAVFALPLAGVPYWVTAAPSPRLLPAIAYHQLLPVLGLAALGWACVAAPAAEGAGRARRAGFALAVGGLVALAYSSGAFALLVFGATLVALAGRRRDPDEAALAPLALAIAGVGGAGVVAHVGAPLLALGVNPVLETRDFEPASPLRPEFWVFAAGLFDRAVLATRVGGAALARGAAVAASLALPALALAVLAARGDLRADERRRAAVLAALLLAVLGYAALVSYGRANFGDFYYWPRRLESLHRAALYAHARPFYWWIAAALPFAVAGWGLALERLVPRRIAAGAALLLAAALLWPKPQHPEWDGSYLTHWRYGALYAADAARLRAQIARDAEASRERSRRPRSGRAPGWQETMYRRARALDATFVERWGLLPTGAPPAAR